MDLIQPFIGGFAASIVWFVIGGALYMNPYISRIYRDAESSPALKKWDNIPRYLGFQYGGILLQCLIWAYVFALVRPALPQELAMRGLVFGLILVAVKIIPRCNDMWIQTTYPGRLLAVELINGVIGSIVIGLVFAYTIV